MAFFNYSGTLTQLTLDLTNAYSGDVIMIDDEYVVSDTVYEGTEDFDFFSMTSLGDAVFISSATLNPENVGIQLIQDIELFIASDGGDIIDLSSTEFILGNVQISGGSGDDILWGNYGDDLITGSFGNDILDGGPGHDHLEGQQDDDILAGGQGDDYLLGGDGNDQLYGGWDLGLTELDKDFVDGITFPELVEGADIRDLLPGGEIGFGVSSENLTVDFDASATLTFRDGFAGYENTLGVYKIGEDGTMENIQVLWGNVKDAGIDTEHQIDLPVDADGGEFGFFILADGYTRNGNYAGLDMEGDGVLNFIYDYGGANERAATVNDDGSLVSVVYDDGETLQVIDAMHWHTTPRDGSNIINSDGETHAISGIIAEGNDNILRIGFEDLTNLGDADFEDVLFDVDINTVQVDNSEQGADTLDGGAGDDLLYGEAGDDLLIFGEGADEVHGGSGSDTLYMTFLDAATDTIVGFETGAGGDVLDVSDILTGFDPFSDSIAEFIAVVDNGNDTDILVDADGGADNFVTALTIQGGINDSFADLLANGNLVVTDSI